MVAYLWVVAFGEVFLVFIFLYFSQDGGEGLFVWVFFLFFFALLLKFGITCGIPNYPVYPGPGSESTKS